ncbi:MAG: Na+/H+ antiporter subunit C [Steroidobacteraceae bacterium]|jgi:multicomponent K+:H+ antiporter subunit C|nr:Na+/H+ antiporter subunit C [Steroidobacteraceae bacterium]
MELLLASGIGLLAAAGTWLVLRARTFDVVLGMTLLSYAVNLFVFAMGRLRVDAVPLLRDPALTPSLANHADPVPQALVLTAIVISFGMTAVLLALAVRSHLEHDDDHVDGSPR